jgi:hypothetical protein
MPRVSIRAVEHALEAKKFPHRVDESVWFEAPVRIRMKHTGRTLCIFRQRLQGPVKLFGRDMTKQGALMLILNDQHEHLGTRSPTRAATAWFPPGRSRIVDRLRKVLVHGIGSP